MKKTWDHKDYRKFFQAINNEKNQERFINECADKPLEDEIIIKQIKYGLKEDYLRFLDDMEALIYEVEYEGMDNINAVIKENSMLNTDEKIKVEIEYYHFFKTVIKDITKYKTKYTIDQILDLLNQDMIDYEDIGYYLLSIYYSDYKLSKKDYLSDDHKHMIYMIIDASLHQKKDPLYNYAIQIKQEKLKELEEIKSKKAIKIITKSKSKLNKIYSQKNKTRGEIIEEVKELENRTISKLNQIIDSSNFINYPQIDDFLCDCKDIPKHFVDQKIETIKEEKQVIYDIDVSIIEDFYIAHHLYFKKTQIIQEATKYPSIITFYQFYNNIKDNKDNEEIINKLEEMILDIKDSGLQKTESLRRLIIIAKKDINTIINESKSVEDIEEEIIEEVEEESSTIQIGKFSLVEESVQDNPIDIQKLICLLNQESQHHVNELMRLIYQIGYDKVHAYLLKADHLYIEDLEAIIRVDRQLRFEYQRILEDIEMYFRSSLTYYLTNKYDQKYKVAGEKHYFYKRCYLMKTNFIDIDEHFEHVKQLRERIDAEIKSNNIQIINEYKRYKYAIPFSSAAGIMTFGWLIMMFDNLNYNDKLEYLNLYYNQITPQSFSNWMNSLTALRNRCAHYHSLYRISSLKELRPIMTKGCDANVIDDQIKHSSLFYYTIVMTRIAPDIHNIEDFIDDIGILFRKAQRENYTFDLLKDYSFPKNWRTLLENEKSVKVYK